MTTAAKKQRIEVRCTDDQRSLIDKALDLSGRSLTDFVLSAVQEAAMHTIKDYEIISLNRHDSLALAAALLKPATPNERLRAAKEKHHAEATKPIAEAGLGRIRATAS